MLALSWLALVATRSASGVNLVATHPVVSYALALLVGWTALSAAWAGDSGSAVAVAYRLLLDAILYVIVYTAVSDRRTARLTIVAFVVGAAAVGHIRAVCDPGRDRCIGTARRWGLGPE